MKLTKRIIKGGKKASKRRTKTKSKTIKRKNKRFSRYGGKGISTQQPAQERQVPDRMEIERERQRREDMAQRRHMNDLEGPDGLFGNVPSTPPNVIRELWNQATNNTRTSSTTTIP